MQEFVCFDYIDLVTTIKRLQAPVVLVSNNGNRLFLSAATVKSLPNEQLKSHIDQLLTNGDTGISYSKTEPVFPVVVRDRR